MNLSLDLFAEPEPVAAPPVQAPRTTVVQVGAAPPPVHLIVHDRRERAYLMAAAEALEADRYCAAARFLWAWKRVGHPAFALGPVHPASYRDQLVEAARAANHILRGVASDRPYVDVARFVEARQKLEAQGANAA